MCGAELHVLPEGVQRVARALQDAHHPHAPVMLDGAARTAQEAADSLGVQLGQIAKSVIFKRKADGVAVLADRHARQHDDKAGDDGPDPQQVHRPERRRVGAGQAVDHHHVTARANTPMI
jgi:hypothetical protein